MNAETPAGRAEYAVLTRDDLVTGEAVALDLPAASPGTRLVSGLLDLLVTAALLVGVLLVLSVAVSRTDAALAWAAGIASVVTVFVAVPTAVETVTRGRSLGKWAMGLRTVRDDAGPISFQHALVRALVGVVEIYAFSGAPAFFAMIVSERGKRLGDFAAGTYVVRDRVRLRLPPPPAMPPPLADWATGADIAGLPVNLALAVRQFLGRAGETDPATRWELGSRLAAAVAPYVAPLPPPGTPPEAFLAAVIAARRHRDAVRLSREEDLRRRLARR